MKLEHACLDDDSIFGHFRTNGKFGNIRCAPEFDVEAIYGHMRKYPIYNLQLYSHKNIRGWYNSYFDFFVFVFCPGLCMKLMLQDTTLNHAKALPRNSVSEM